MDLAIENFKCWDSSNGSIKKSFWSFLFIFYNPVNIALATANTAGQKLWYNTKSRIFNWYKNLFFSAPFQFLVKQFQNEQKLFSLTVKRLLKFFLNFCWGENICLVVTSLSSWWARLNFEKYSICFKGAACTFISYKNQKFCFFALEVLYSNRISLKF